MPSAKPRRGDTLDEVLGGARPRRLLDWLLRLPLAHHDAARGDLLVHAGLVPQWSVADTLRLAGEVQAALRADPEAFFDGMYGNRPDRWSESLEGAERLRFTVNVLTRCASVHRRRPIDLREKGPPSRGACALAAVVRHRRPRERAARAWCSATGRRSASTPVTTCWPRHRLRLGRHAHRDRSECRGRAARQ